VTEQKRATAARPDRSEAARGAPEVVRVAPKLSGEGALRGEPLQGVGLHVTVPHLEEANGGPEHELPALGIPERVQFHVLSFEGPDPYSRIGGLETRVGGICEALVSAGHEAHLWFVGDPELPGYENRDGLVLHRFCQWLSRHHLNGVYDGQSSKVPDYASSLPPYLLAEHLLPHLRSGGLAVVLAEEWQTADAVLHLDHLLRQAGLRRRVRMLWNANNIFGFEQIDWPRMRKAAVVTTVSRYMKQMMKAAGVEAIAIPNGLAPDAYLPPDRSAVAHLRRSFAGRTAITKMARWDPDKRWIGSVEIIAALRDLGMKPLLIARGGREPHGLEVLDAMRSAGLRIVERGYSSGDERGLVQALSDLGRADVVHLTTHVDPDSRRAPRERRRRRERRRGRASPSSAWRG
jgi:glycosyltransferase involved in cell wall biosynthesis